MQTAAFVLSVVDTVVLFGGIGIGVKAALKISKEFKGLGSIMGGKK
jgi:hypothetical protein